MMRNRDSLIVIAAMCAVSFFWAVGSTVANEQVSQVGRYQASAVLKQDGANRVFITVIDTTNGELVARWRADPGDYKRAEGDRFLLRPRETDVQSR